MGAHMTEPILSFSGPYRFLSNFYVLPEPIEWDGLHFWTTEHAFQAAKTHDIRSKRRIQALPANRPGDAKAVGATVSLRPDWEAVKINVMEALLCLKFSHPILMKWLLETGDAHLEEGNHWKDRFWGTVDRKGRNELGKALMRVRAAIRANVES
jgi:ribA/ribD-fused uncharacterized protein